MTLIVAIRAEDGVVFGSDTQVTTGVVRSRATKIFPLNDKALWGASGELALIQRVAAGLENLPSRLEPLGTIRDTVAQIVNASVQDLINLDFRTRFVAQDADALLNLHPGDFLFVEHRDRPRILHIMVNGTPEFIDGPFAATGSGDLFAHALLSKYAESSLKCTHAKLLAFKVIEEAIQVGAYGLGPPIDIWQVGSTGVQRVPEEEMAALADSARAPTGARSPNAYH